MAPHRGALLQPPSHGTHSRGANTGQRSVTVADAPAVSTTGPDNINARTLNRSTDHPRVSATTIDPAPKQASASATPTSPPPRWERTMTTVSARTRWAVRPGRVAAQPGHPPGALRPGSGSGWSGRRERAWSNGAPVSPRWPTPGPEGGPRVLLARFRNRGLLRHGREGRRAPDWAHRVAPPNRCPGRAPTAPSSSLRRPSRAGAGGQAGSVCPCVRGGSGDLFFISFRW